jgi:hypothetical protein
MIDKIDSQSASAPSPTLTTLAASDFKARFMHCLASPADAATLISYDSGFLL